MNELSKRAQAWLLVLFLTTASAWPSQAKGRLELKRVTQWRAVHVLDYNSDADLETLGENLGQLAHMGINTVILEIDYNFAFKSHPELRRGSNPISREGARKLTKSCRKLGIRLIPEFQSLGHQSWKGETFPLLSAYPLFDVTPGAFPGNEGIYCREWDPLNPAVTRIIFQLMDEIIEAFDADALHVGMDEIFLLGSDLSPSTRAQDPARLFAKAVNDIHRHLVRERRVEMLMWGDRLIDGKSYTYGEWESSMNGTAGAIDMIPKDIIVCPWHYEPRDSYPSIPMFLNKGFRVLPAGWNNAEATKALIEYSRQYDDPKLLGYMFTTWGVKKETLVEFAPLVDGLKLLLTGTPPNPENKQHDKEKSVSSVFGRYDDNDGCNRRCQRSIGRSPGL